MRTLLRTDSSHPDFRALVQLLDTYLSKVNGEQDAFFSAFNKIDQLKNVVVAYEGGRPVGCGAFKPYEGMAEIKRMYTREEQRGKGVAGAVLKELEQWAAEEGYTYCVLETGSFMPDAVALYAKHQYEVIANYGQYADSKDSVCMKKRVVTR
ncbi:GNAT family N-acetyltransferase [Chitinophaga sedimenti]|uniref:GNAT family N-acetyltransferase n=1 Tax=Chitinophaga sedimenti TaxID=2033606 RepID=UPI00200574E3|nr:GNAT family N-acetyltransferase [Chitinophaga sedimenti]MCK7557244.1 GNAT family N-acetyltransferase [Chitinophaga sedimenti]